MKERITIWLDDQRNPQSHSWSMLVDAYAPGTTVIWVKTVTQFCDAVTRVLDQENQELAALFFDNDLGTRLEGYNAFNWFESLVHEKNLTKVVLYAQTQNTAAKQRIEQGIASLERFWEDQED